MSEKKKKKKVKKTGENEKKIAVKTVKDRLEKDTDSLLVFNNLKNFCNLSKIEALISPIDTMLEINSFTQDFQRILETAFSMSVSFSRAKEIVKNIGTSIFNIDSDIDSETLKIFKDSILITLVSNITELLVGKGILTQDIAQLYKEQYVSYILGKTKNAPVVEITDKRTKYVDR